MVSRRPSLRLSMSQGVYACPRPGRVLGMVPAYRAAVLLEPGLACPLDILGGYGLDALKVLAEGLVPHRDLTLSDGEGQGGHAIFSVDVIDAVLLLGPPQLSLGDRALLEALDLTPQGLFDGAAVLPWSSVGLNEKQIGISSISGHIKGIG